MSVMETMLSRALAIGFINHDIIITSRALVLLKARCTTYGERGSRVRYVAVCAVNEVTVWKTGDAVIYSNHLRDSSAPGFVEILIGSREQSDANIDSTLRTPNLRCNICGADANFECATE